MNLRDEELPENILKDAYGETKCTKGSDNRTSDKIIKDMIDITLGQIGKKEMYCWNCDKPIWMPVTCDQEAHKPCCSEQCEQDKRNHYDDIRNNHV